MATPAVVMTDEDAGAVAAVRAFNRFYTNVIGLLRGGYLDSPYSLTEVRVLFELSRQEETEAAGLRRSLGIDAGYLSRILARFDAEKLTVRQRSAADGRRQVSKELPGHRVLVGADGVLILVDLEVDLAFVFHWVLRLGSRVGR